ncbi:MAG: type I restriction endonuclease [Lachnospiraceae bacterium]|nr:type I restriction endonuclease [Lachnospiraceae bacterium]
MDFKDTITELAEKAARLKQAEGVTEEATKMTLIIPMLRALGYDPENYNEVRPEYTASYGIKKGEKVDYAILDNDVPIILIECKPCTEQLDKHIDQLYSYFGATDAKFGILTNGIEYWFYTDLDKNNQMDSEPFLTFDIENISESQLTALSKFKKETFNPDAILSDAERLKYTGRINDYLSREFADMDDDFASFIIKKSDAYRGAALTKKALSLSKPLVIKAFTSLVNDEVNRRIKSAINEQEEAEEQEEPAPKIVTTKEEIQSFFIVRGILAGTVPVEDITYKDTASYFNILYQSNSWKPICRIYLDGRNKKIRISSGETDSSGRKAFIDHQIESTDDIYKYKDELIKAVRRYL